MADDYFKFLIHDSFLPYLKDFRKLYSHEFGKSFDTQLVKCITNPLTAGKRLHLGKTQLFGGFIYRLTIGGIGGYRLIYYASPAQKVVLGVFISTKRRGNFDYSDYDWDSIIGPILKDFHNRNYNAFQSLQDYLSPKNK